MHLPFLGRTREHSRLLRALRAPEGQLVCVVGRRRLGKSRLLQEVLWGLPAVYVVGDDRSAPLLREVVAREVERLLPVFSQVKYPSWDALLERWYRDAPAGAVLALDEFPSFVASSPELPSVRQKWVDTRWLPARHLALCGSSQRMMLELLLDATAPLYGRAREILRLGPLEIATLPEALHLRSVRQVVEHWAVWGGVPRYWELAADYDDLWSAVSDLVLDPMGILHQESERLLLDDMREVARAGSLLALVGQGCGRPSELGARLGQPTTSFARPLARLVELGLLGREVPWGAEPRDTKRSLYRVSDPFLAFWYRFGDPERSRLGAGQIEAVRAEIRPQWLPYLGKVWEDLARQRGAAWRRGHHVAPGLALVGAWRRAGHRGSGGDGSPAGACRGSKAPCAARRGAPTAGGPGAEGGVGSRSTGASAGSQAVDPRRRACGHTRGERRRGCDGRGGRYGGWAFRMTCLVEATERGGRIGQDQLGRPVTCPETRR